MNLIGTVIGSRPFVGSVFELDAGLLDSYNGSSQTWSNLVASPADGSAQTAYDFQLGASSSIEASDPIFHGIAGMNDESEYFASNGNQYMRLASTNTTFINNLHKDNAIFTWYGIVQLGDLITGINLFSTLATTLTNAGISIRLGTSGLELTQGNGSASQVVHVSTTLALSPSQKIFVAVSYTESTGVGLMYVNGPVARTTESFTQAYVAPTSANCTTYPTMMAYAGNGNSSMQATSPTILHRCGLGNVALNAAQLDVIYNRYKYLIGL